MTLELDSSATTPADGTSARIAAGARGAGDYRCLDCGYGIATFGLVPTCPMCHGSDWEPAPRSPFSGRAARPLPEY
jgi:hypothetical protein